MQAVRGFSQIAAQKQQPGFLQKQQIERRAESMAGAHLDQPDQRPQLAKPAAATNSLDSPSGVLQGTSTGQLLPNSCQETCQETLEADAGPALHCQPQHTAVSSPPAPSSSMAADSHLQLPQPEGESQQLAGSHIKTTEQSTSVQPSRPMLNDWCIQQPASTHDAEQDAKVQQKSQRSGSRLAEPSRQSRSLPVSRTLKKRAAPQPDTIACKQAGEPCRTADFPQSVNKLAQGQDGRTMPANTHGVTARAAKRAKQAVASTDDADGFVKAMPQHRASKAPAQALTRASRPAGKAHAAGKASPAAAVVSQPRAGSSEEAQQSQHEPVSRRSLRPRQAHTTAVVDSSSEHDSNISNFADESSDADSAAELRADASGHESADKAGLNACKVARARKRQISASAGRKARRQHLSSTDEEEDIALMETAVCDSGADAVGTDEVLGESSEEELARSGKAARLPAKNGFQKRTGGQQAKQAAAGPGRGGRGGAAGTGQGGYKRTATRQNFVRSNLKASCITHGCRMHCTRLHECEPGPLGLCGIHLLLICLFICHSIRSLTRLLTHSFVCLTVCLFFQFIHPFIHSRHAHMGWQLYSQWCQLE